MDSADIHSVLKHSFSALSHRDLRACVIGGAAALVYGVVHRKPNDVDLLILNATFPDAEEIKRIIVEVDSSHFSLTPSRVVGATHCILWCSLDTNRSCKVDIQTPNQLYMTHIPESKLYRDSSETFTSYFSHLQPESPLQVPISYMPLLNLLMLKLRAWVDHSLPSANEIKHGKIPQDEGDIHEILQLSSRDSMTLTGRFTEEGDIWMLGGFASWKEAGRSVEKYVKKWPETATGWRAVGFG